jgi:glucose/arabinose dehydrogenase
MVSLVAAAVLLGTGLAVTTAAGATQTAAPTDVLLSKNHPVTAFTTKAGFPAKNAVDGKTSTRWASNSGTTQWIAVDLGAMKDIVRVRLVWDAACASAYQLQTSPGNGVWTTIFSTTKGNGGVDNVKVHGSGRSVRVFMTKRCPGAPGKGYSLREFQVYGPAGPLLPPRNPHLIGSTCTTVTIGWDPFPVPPAFIDAFRDGQAVGTVTGDKTSMTIPVSPNFTFGIYFVSRDAAGNVSPPSDSLSVTTPPCDDHTPPTPPRNLHAIDITDTCVTLAWDPSQDDTGVVGYRVYLGGPPDLVGQTPDTTLVICGLTPSTTYTFVTTAIDAAGNESGLSNQLAVTTRSRDFCHVCSVTVVATSTDIPWGLVTLPDGSVLFTERDTAALVHIEANGSTKVVGHVPNVQTTNGQGGLTGLEISPSFGTDHWLYFFHTSPTDNRIVRIKYTNGALQTSTEQVLLPGIPRNKFNDGGRLRFGPDRKLYAATGDAQNGANAQNLNSLAGKILRLNPDGTVPPDNPFASYVWSLGHRNVMGLAFDSKGRLWAAEMGSSRMDELDLVVKGGNYGWPACEGTIGDCAHPEYLAPVRTFNVAAASPGGLAIVRDVLYMTALRGTRLYRMVIQGNGTAPPEQYLLGIYGRLRTVEPAPDGGLWLTTSNNDGVPSPRNNKILHVVLGR